MILNMGRLATTPLNRSDDYAEEQQKAFDNAFISQRLYLVLQKMLNYEPENRPDFLMLYEELAEWNLPVRLIAEDKTEEQLTD